MQTDEQVRTLEIRLENAKAEANELRSLNAHLRDQLYTVSLNAASATKRFERAIAMVAKLGRGLDEQGIDIFKFVPELYSLRAQTTQSEVSGYRLRAGVRKALGQNNAQEGSQAQSSERKETTTAETDDSRFLTESDKRSRS